MRFPQLSSHGTAAAKLRLYPCLSPLLFIALVFAGASCAQEPLTPIVPSWDVDLTLPLAHRSCTLSQIVEKDTALLRAGVTLNVHSLPLLGLVPGEMLIGLDYSQGLNEVPGTTKTPRASENADWFFVPKPFSRGSLAAGLSERL